MSFPVADLVDLVDAGQVWVACSDNDVPVGMVIASVERERCTSRRWASCLRTVDADSERLLATIYEWAQAHGHAAITLRPSATCLGMARSIGRTASRDLDATEWTPGMRAIREREAGHGLRVEARVFMRRDLNGRMAGLTLDERSETRFSPAVSRPGRPPRGEALAWVSVETLPVGRTAAAFVAYERCQYRCSI